MKEDGGAERVACPGRCLEIQLVSVFSVPGSSARQGPHDRDGLTLLSTVTSHRMTDLVLLGRDRPPSTLNYCSQR
ncbi:rCG28836 [Rattus norvegicus]|uniref:RCG28836 n=1 Tax=Rattus norvegicus TaxID=10116 RepID=A6HW18_RAT|nr:rCG28836 [Rattus norvegicus]